MYINTFKYKPEDVSCVLCTEYVKKLGCTALSCPCLAERMEAGTVGYAEAVAELFPYRPRLTARIMRLAESFPGTMWQDNAHRKRMETLRLLLGCRKERDTPEFFAALTKKVAAALLADGRVKLTGLYSEKTGGTYDATAVLEDTGESVRFRLEFDKGART